MPREAARVGDEHTCPVVDEISPAHTEKAGWFKTKDIPAVKKPHEGGPIKDPGSPNVKIENKPAARCGDKAGCKGIPTTDVIVTGSATVKINGVLAALKGSLCMHKGAVSAGSSTVKYGDAVAGATLGNPGAGTAACMEAAKTRKRYLDRIANLQDINNDAFDQRFADWRKTHPNSDPKEFFDQMVTSSGSSHPMRDDFPGQGKFMQAQGHDMNCVHETVRQTCIQKCKEGVAKACEACKYSEDEWYKRYVREMREKHNSFSESAVNDTRKENDAAWARIMAAEKVFSTSGKEFDRKDQTWEKNQGGDFRLEDRGGKIVKIKQLPDSSQITDEDVEATKKDPWDPRHIGATDATRQAMLRDWCGLDPKVGGNTPTDIAGDLGQGKTVLATVDAYTLNPTSADKEMSEQDKLKRGIGLHQVQVTGMEFDENGNLKTVVMNDVGVVTRQGFGEEGVSCGRKVEGEQFNAALVEGFPSDVV